MSKPISSTGGFIPGSLASAANFDPAAALDSAYRADLLSAQIRTQREGAARGFELSDAEARAEAIRRFDAGDTSVMPQYARIAARLTRSR